jgi:hypothetical protein
VTTPIDAELWDRVSEMRAHTAPIDEFEGWSIVGDDDSDTRLDRDLHSPDQPCAECGETGACAYDIEGRPLIHAHGWS